LAQCRRSLLKEKEKKKKSPRKRGKKNKEQKKRTKKPTCLLANQNVLRLPARQAASWTTSVFLNARLAYGRFTSSLGAPYQASLTSARAAIEAFVRTAAHNYSVPAAVTVATETPTYYAQPAWYTALPSGARAFKEQQVADQFRIVQSVIRGRQATSSSSSNAAGAAAPTPRLHVWAGSKEFGVLAGVAVAAFL